MRARSEQELQAELNLAVRCNRRCDISRCPHRSARGRVHGAVRYRWREVRVVEDVIKLGAELKLHPIALAWDRCRLHGREIERIQQWTEQRVSACVAINSSSV